MSSNVFANGNEVSAKKDGNKSMGTFPDVCLSPPSPPAGPIPIPYPNNTDSSKTSGGSKTVKIGGAEVGLKNRSVYKKSAGNEAATKSLGMGIVSHNISGALKHAAWSMDVKIEGQNAIRHLDMVTQNHINMGNAVGIDLGAIKPPSGDPECVELEEAAREDLKEDIVGGVLPPKVALVTARHSSGRNYRAIQSDDRVKSSKKGRYSPPTKQAGDTMACGGSSEMKYGSNDQNNSMHSEAKIIEDVILGQPTGGSLTMRINWNNKGTLDPSPCKQCMGTICKTAVQCGIDIQICLGEPMTKKKAPCKTTKHGADKVRDLGRSTTTRWETPRGFFS